jgi:hypothetical protein
MATTCDCSTHRNVLGDGLIFFLQQSSESEPICPTWKITCIVLFRTTFPLSTRIVSHLKRCWLVLFWLQKFYSVLPFHPRLTRLSLVTPLPTCHIIAPLIGALNRVLFWNIGLYRQKHAPTRTLFYKKWVLNIVPHYTGVISSFLHYSYFYFLNNMIYFLIIWHRAVLLELQTFLWP